MIEAVVSVQKPVSAARADATPCVFIVDDDISVRESLELLLKAAGWQALSFACAADFLAYPKVSGPSCLVLDVGLPDLNGLDLQDRFAPDGATTPIIFITGYADIPMTVRAMKAGAVEFLTKPVCDDALLTAIERALEVSSAQLRREAEMVALRNRYASLTRREARGHDARRGGAPEQAGRVRAGHQRDHREGTPRQADAQDGGSQPTGSRQDGGPAWHRRVRDAPGD